MLCILFFKIYIYVRFQFQRIQSLEHEINIFFLFWKHENLAFANLILRVGIRIQAFRVAFLIFLVSWEFNPPINSGR